MIFPIIFFSLLLLNKADYFNDSCGKNNALAEYARDVAKPGQLPYYVNFRVPHGDYNICGGALISDKWVITSANCVGKDQNFTLRFGSNRFSDKDNRRFEIETIRAISYPDYLNDENPQIQHNIALLELSQPIRFNDVIQPIALATEFPPDNLNVTICGFTISSAKKVTKFLKFALYKTANQDVCYKEFSQRHPKTICAEPRDDLQESICTGDFGGPLTANLDGKPVLVGVAIDSNCQKGKATLYASIAYNLDWIKKTAGL